MLCHETYLYQVYGLPGNREINYNPSDLAIILR